MRTKEQILEENKRESDHYTDQGWYDEDIIKMMEEYVKQEVQKSLPLSALIDYCERSEDFYIEDGEIENNFYNAALKDIKYWGLKYK